MGIKCPEIYSISLDGTLCEDIFFVIGVWCKLLRELNFSYCKASNGWLRWIANDAMTVTDTLWYVTVERSWWCDDETLWYLSHCKNLATVSSEKWNVSGSGLLDLFKGCPDLLSLRLDRCVDEDGEWEEAFKCLADTNAKIEHISFNGCEGFNDECLAYLMQPSSCPKLTELTIHYHGCSQKMIRKFQKKRPNVDISGDSGAF